MSKTILITGSTDGIGLLTARKLIEAGHTVLLHGRNSSKLEAAQQSLATAINNAKVTNNAKIRGYLADLSDMDQVATLAAAIQAEHAQLDVLINNAGIYNTPVAITKDDLDIRFAVNTYAPYILTKQLIPLLSNEGRVVNLSSAAQTPVDLKALAGHALLTDGPAYAQSKLALTMWSRQLGLQYKDSGPMIVAVNPGSLLASKMVKEAYGIPGSDLSIGADILVRAALSDEFSTASGEYFDNDAKCFNTPHSDALNAEKCSEVLRVMDKTLKRIVGD